MNKYEAMYILEADQTDEAIAAQVEKFNNLVAASGAQLEETKLWGKRRLAYPINDKNDGYYVLMHFASAPDFPTELERNFKIDEHVVRYMVIRLEDEEA